MLNLSNEFIEKLNAIRRIQRYLSTVYPASVIQLDPLYLMGCAPEPVLDFDLFRRHIDKDIREGESYADYFKEMFGDRADEIADAFRVRI